MIPSNLKSTKELIGLTEAFQKTSPNRLEIIKNPTYHESIYSDLYSLIYLFILYTIQGVPMGLSASIPFIIQKHVTYKQLAAFSLASLPFSFKILWAPVVDSMYFKSVGLRKTWLIPSQLISAFIMYFGGQPWAVSSWLGPAGHLTQKPDTVNIWALIAFFGSLYFLMATQDIAVDGWALTLLNPQNRHLGSICNTLGQTVGFSVANVGFLALLNPDLCNRWLRKNPSPEPLITLGGFLRFWGILIFIATLLAVLFPEGHSDYQPIENNFNHMNDSNIPVSNAYILLLKILKLEPVITLIIILLTCRIAFAPADVALQLKLVSAGISKEEIALYGPLIIPASIICPILLSKKLSENRQIDWFIYAYVLRLIIMLVWIYILHLVQSYNLMANVGSSIPFWLHCIIFFNFLLYTIASDAMFFSQMAFFAKIADHVIGGTYMTLLNTIANLGNKWPHTASLMSLNYFESFKFMDGVILQMMFSTFIGLLWLYYMLPYLEYLKKSESNKWLVSTEHH